MAKDYTKSLNLPVTSFPMRASLPQREPDMLRYWEELDLYGKMQETAADRPLFVLHDGPPFSNGNELIRAIEERQQVVLRNYASSNSGDVRDRLVEPFAFTTNYIQIWCYEPESGMNKQFRISRIGSVEASKEKWQHSEKHRSEKSDIFRTGGTEGTNLKLKLGVMAKNLLLEEYPLAERDLTQIDSEHWLLDTIIYRPAGAGRFIIGLANDIEIIEGESIKTYLKEFMEKYYSRIVN